ncbi:MAG: hypothetical protein HZB16_23745 [Armatimonadetes bacterium]|nr:hypothetical protein [Armatimonadota bacterium]
MSVRRLMLINAALLTSCLTLGTTGCGGHAALLLTDYTTLIGRWHNDTGDLVITRQAGTNTIDITFPSGDGTTSWLLRGTMTLTNGTWQGNMTLASGPSPDQAPGLTIGQTDAVQLQVSGNQLTMTINDLGQNQVDGDGNPVVLSQTDTWTWVTEQL